MAVVVILVSFYFIDIIYILGSSCNCDVTPIREVRDLRGVLVAEGMDAGDAGYALLPGISGGQNPARETSTHFHEAELAATLGSKGYDVTKLLGAAGWALGEVPSCFV